MTPNERRTEKKRKQKEMFDSQYDNKGDTLFYDTWKAQAEEQARVRMLYIIIDFLFIYLYHIKPCDVIL